MFCSIAHPASSYLLAAKEKTTQATPPLSLPCLAPGDDLYFSETLNYCIRKVTLSTQTVTDAAGTCLSPGFTDGPAATAQFGTNGPRGLAFQGSDLYIVDQGNNVIRVLWAANNSVTTVAGESLSSCLGCPAAAAVRRMSKVVATGGRLWRCYATPGA